MDHFVSVLKGVRGDFIWVDGLPLTRFESAAKDEDAARDDAWNDTGFVVECNNSTALGACFGHVTAARMNAAHYDLARPPVCKLSDCKDLFMVYTLAATPGMVEKQR